MKPRYPLPTCFLALLAALAVLLTPSCAFLQKNITPANLQTACEGIAYGGASARLAAHPDDAPRFALAVAALDVVIADGHFDPVSLHTALSTLPVDFLKGETGTIIISTALVLVETVTGGKTPLEQAPYVQAAAKGIRMGLAMALPGATVLPLVYPDPLAVTWPNIAYPNLAPAAHRTITLHSNQAVSVGKTTYWNGEMPCQAISGCTQESKTLWLIPPGCHLEVGTTITVVGVK